MFKLILNAILITALLLFYKCDNNSPRTSAKLKIDTLEFSEFDHHQPLWNTYYSYYSHNDSLPRVDWNKNYKLLDTFSFDLFTIRDKHYYQNSNEFEVVCYLDTINCKEIMLFSTELGSIMYSIWLYQFNKLNFSYSVQNLYPFARYIQSNYINYGDSMEDRIEFFYADSFAHDKPKTYTYNNFYIKKYSPKKYGFGIKMLYIKKGLTEKQVYEKSKSFQQDYKLITNYRKVKKPRKKIY